MTEHGLLKIKLAKQLGRWEKPISSELSYDMPDEFRTALVNNPIAKKQFEQLASTYKKHYIGWISSAKKPGTRLRRAEEAIALLKEAKKLGMK